ncbi:lipocalin family protein [Maribacter sp. MJ134]|uniref:lipocalin family protein n=1 Tax=Maribacter sp. MJ134 TaxID=2496865 RepID=UPI001F498358|nr:lipocalin family protein [Maribacter sp. MJ134]
MMLKKICGSIALVSLLFSCSSDKDSDSMDSSPSAIIGTWDATELVIDNTTASDDAKFGKQILDFLTDKDCYIITLQFNEDLTAEATNAANFVEVNATATGLDVPCPTESDSESSTYTFDGSVVSIVDMNGDTINVDVLIQGDIMTVDAADLEIPNFDDSGELIFRKR